MLLIVSIISGVMSGVFQLFGYFEYFKKTIKGRIVPNSASWGIWAVGAVLESVSYIFVTKDLVKNILPIICALCAIFFFIHSLKTGVFSRPTKFEWNLIFADITILMIWWLTTSSVVANILFVVTAIVSFIPISINAYKKPETEHSLPWFLWAVAYAIMVITVLTRWEKWEDMVYPAVFLILHLIIAYFALDSRNKAKSVNII